YANFLPNCLQAGSNAGFSPRSSTVGPNRSNIRVHMRLPIVPAIIAAALLGAAWYLFNASRSGVRILDVPRLSRLADIEGVETEVAVSGAGVYAVVSSGDLWLLNTSNGARRRLTQTSEPESFPAWTPDGKRITFTRGADTFVIEPDSN